MTNDILYFSDNWVQLNLTARYRRQLLSKHVPNKGYDIKHWLHQCILHNVFFFCTL